MTGGNRKHGKRRSLLRSGALQNAEGCGPTPEAAAKAPPEEDGNTGVAMRCKVARAVDRRRDTLMRWATRDDMRPVASPDVADASLANQAMGFRSLEDQGLLWASQTMGVKLNPAASAPSSVSLKLRLKSP